MDSSLFLSAKNLLSLRGMLNSIHLHPGYQDRYKDRLSASDLSFLSYEASLRPSHTPPHRFHEAFFKFREGTTDRSLRYLIQLKMRRAIFDHAAALDLMTGATTLVVHMPGAQEPGTPASPEFLKAYVYVPRSVLQEIENQGLENPVPDLVQNIIKELHVPTVERFQRARESVWKVSKASGSHPPRALPEIRGMPTPIPEGSSRYVFYGRKGQDDPEASTWFGVFEGCSLDLEDGTATGTSTVSSGDVD